jgi:hypothetical protein
MSIKDITLILLWLLIVTVSTAVTYKVYVVDKDYKILSVTSCDPAEASCFVSEKEAKYFQYIEKSAKYIEECDARKQECKPLRCSEKEQGCQLITCDTDTLRDYARPGVACSDKAMIIQKPVEQPVEVKTETAAPQVEELTPAPVEVQRAPIDSNQEEAIPVAPEPTPAPVAPAPEEEELEPNHNLPI